MAPSAQGKNRRLIAISYVFMFLALFTFVGGIIAYLLASSVHQVQHNEVWLRAQALWIMRNSLIYFMLMGFGGLWLIPLHFFYWDTYLWVTACMVIGVIFLSIASLYLLNAWLKGLGKFLKNKAVY